jgi:hypothetical protein
MPGLPTQEEIDEYYASYPPEFVKCRTFRHGPEKSYRVEDNRTKDRRHGEVTVVRVCACRRFVFRTYRVTSLGSLAYLSDRTRAKYPKGYLALKGAGFDKDLINARAVDAEIAELEQADKALKAAAAPAVKPARKASSKRTTRT